MRLQTIGTSYEYPGGTVIAEMPRNFTVKGRKKYQIAQVLTLRPKATEAILISETGLSSTNLRNLVIELVADDHLLPDENGCYTLADPRSGLMPGPGARLRRRMEFAIAEEVSRAGAEGQRIVRIAQTLGTTPAITREVSETLIDLRIVSRKGDRLVPFTGPPGRWKASYDFDPYDQIYNRPKKKKRKTKKSAKERLYDILEADRGGVYGLRDFRTKLKLSNDKARALAEQLVDEGRIERYEEGAYFHLQYPSFDEKRELSFDTSRIYRHRS